VQKTKGSHGGARANAGRKPSTSKLAAAAMGTSTLHTMGFKADYGTKATTATCVATSTGATAASGSSSDDDSEGWRTFGADCDERMSDDEGEEGESAPPAAAPAAATTAAAAAATATTATATATAAVAEAGSSCSIEDRLGKLNSDMPSLAKELAHLMGGGSSKEGVGTVAEGIESAIKALTTMLSQLKLGVAQCEESVIKVTRNATDELLETAKEAQARLEGAAKEATGAIDQKVEDMQKLLKGHSQLHISFTTLPVKNRPFDTTF